MEKATKRFLAQRQKPAPPYRDIIGWILIGVSVLLIGKSAALCFCDDIWYDELFTVGMIEHSYGELVGFTARDVHPPLYYCIAKCFVDLCKLVFPTAGTVIPAKLASVLPCFFLLIYSVTFVRKRFGVFVSGMFLFCVTTMPQLSGYMVEARMYSWAILFVSAALFHAYGTLAEDGAATVFHSIKIRWLHGAAFWLYGLAAAYTQYFACIAVIMVYGYLLIVFLWKDRGRVKEWFLWAVLSVIGYMPWLFSLIAQLKAVNEDYWILPLTWKSLGGCVKFLLKPFFTYEPVNQIFAVAMFVIYVGIIAACFKKVYHNRRVSAEQMEKFLFACAGLMALVGLVLFGFVVSIAVRPIFVYRYMVSAMGGFWLCFAVCLDIILCKPVDGGEGEKLCKPTDDTKKERYTYNDKILYRLRVCLLSVIIAFVTVIGLRDYRAFLGEEEYKALLMRDTKEVLNSIAPDDAVIYNFNQVQAVTSYYLGKEVGSYLWGSSPEHLIQDIIRPYQTVEDVGEIKTVLQNVSKRGGRVWFMGSFNSRDDIVKMWEKEGLTVELKGSYLLERYWFNLYEITMEGTSV